MIRERKSPTPEWTARWGQLARATGIRSDERLLVALSGGADSVLLVHLLSAARPRPPVLVVHVDHGLRGEESRADALFCARLCRGLGLEYVERSVVLDEVDGSLEARAREARYRILIEESCRTGHRTILTGHHADDVLETLLWRWSRGSSLGGVHGPRGRLQLEVHSGDDSEPLAERTVQIVRPLRTLRREEVRRLLVDRGLLWREDRSNQDQSFTRNRIRHAFLPTLERLCGPEGLSNLISFGRTVEELEERLAGATAHISWSEPTYTVFSRAPGDGSLGGVLARAELMKLSAPLRKRALWRLLTEGTGAGPGRRLLTSILEDLGTGRCTRHTLPGGWSLLLRADQLHLLPPKRLLSARALEAPPTAQGLLPFPRRRFTVTSAEDLLEDAELGLSVPGIVSLPDGRRISAERTVASAKARPASPDHPWSPLSSVSSLSMGGVRGSEVVLDGDGLPNLLRVRFPKPGDRFHALGAPGSKRLTRFLADRGIPREDRARIPLVLAGDEILWVVGLEPGDRHRARAASKHLLKLAFHLPSPVSAEDE